MLIKSLIVQKKSCFPGEMVLYFPYDNLKKVIVSFFVKIFPAVVHCGQSLGKSADVFAVMYVSGATLWQAAWYPCGVSHKTGAIQEIHAHTIHPVRPAETSASNGLCAIRSHL